MAQVIQVIVIMMLNHQVCNTLCINVFQYTVSAFLFVSYTVGTVSSKRGGTSNERWNYHFPSLQK